MCFIQEPVDVEEGGGELVEDEGEAVVVAEGALEMYPNISLDSSSHHLKVWGWY